MSGERIDHSASKDILKKNAKEYGKVLFAVTLGLAVGSSVVLGIRAAHEAFENHRDSR